MEGRCPNCNSVVWQGRQPDVYQLVVCRTCYTDCSLPETPEFRAQDWRRRVAKYVQAYGASEEEAMVVVPYESARMREYPLEVARLKAAQEEMANAGKS